MILINVLIAKTIYSSVRCSASPARRIFAKGTLVCALAHKMSSGWFWDSWIKIGLESKVCFPKPKFATKAKRIVIEISDIILWDYEDYIISNITAIPCRLSLISLLKATQKKRSGTSKKLWRSSMIIASISITLAMLRITNTMIQDLNQTQISSISRIQARHLLKIRCLLHLMWFRHPQQIIHRHLRLRIHMMILDR